MPGLVLFQSERERTTPVLAQVFATLDPMIASQFLPWHFFENPTLLAIEALLECQASSSNRLGLPSLAHNDCVNGTDMLDSASCNSDPQASIRFEIEKRNDTEVS